MGFCLLNGTIQRWEQEDARYAVVLDKWRVGWREERLGGVGCVDFVRRVWRRYPMRVYY